jgi:hypothetical protein
MSWSRKIRKEMNEFIDDPEHNVLSISFDALCALPTYLTIKHDILTNYRMLYEKVIQESTRRGII